MRNKRLLVGMLCAVSAILVLWGYGRLEVYCHFYPSIDTKFAPGFSEKEFSQISSGMLATEVQNRLGKPLLVFTNSPGLEEWLFTDDGKCWWGDFAWLWRSVVNSNNAVVAVERSVRYD